MLARPQLGENIGFVLRLLANHDWDELVLVAPRQGYEDGARRTASMCSERLERVLVCADVGEAVASNDLVVGLTARRGRERDVFSVERLADLLALATRPALVFGNEESGLDAREVAHCNALVTIDRPGLTSLNLSHAVAIAIHEATRQEATATKATGAVTLDATRAAKAPSLATHAERQRVEARLRAMRSSYDFRLDDPHVDGAFARLVKGSRLERRDARMLLRVARHFEWLREARPRDELSDSQSQSGRGPTQDEP